MFLEYSYNHETFSLKNFHKYGNYIHILAAYYQQQVAKQSKKTTPQEEDANSK